MENGEKSNYTGTWEIGRQQTGKKVEESERQTLKKLSGSVDRYRENKKEIYLYQSINRSNLNGLIKKL